VNALKTPSNPCSIRRITKVSMNDNTNGNPIIKVLGTNETKLILHEGTVSEPQRAIGANSNYLWYDTTSAATHDYCSGSVKTISLYKNGK
jgi:hypothetical protein